MPERLLIAEDSRTQREVLRSQLQDAGYEVLAAADGEQALELLQRESVDMLVSDVVMPGMDGYELCRLAKQHDRRLPVILLTSMTDPLDVVHGLQAGADNFLRKPYEFAQLRSRIQMMLHNKQLRESGQTQMGLELFFLNRRFMITAERQQILDLLVSTFEDLVASVEQLREHETQLAGARDELSLQLAEAQAQRERLSAVLSAVPQALVVVDAAGIVTGASEALSRLIGNGHVDGLTGRHISGLFSLTDHTGTPVPDEQRPLARAVREGREVSAGGAFDLLTERQDGQRVPVLLHAAPVFDGSGAPTGAVGVLHELEALSLHDPITRLPKHSLFARYVDAAVTDAEQRQLLTGVLVLVVDRSADLRDSLGTESSDALTRALADALRTALQLPLVARYAPGATAAHLVDMEFAVVLPGLTDQSRGVLVGEAVRSHLSGQYTLGDLSVTVTLTAGLSTTSEGATKAEELVPAAALAAHAGSRVGGDRVESSHPHALELAGGRLRAESDLRRGIEQGELRVHYQPIMALDGGGVTAVGVEALVRWDHPEHGLQAPGEFIPLAEESGLVVPLGWEVLRQACRQLARWRAELPGGGDLTVSVNLSPRQLAQEDVAEQVESVLLDSGLPPHALSLEITESGMVTDAAAAAVQLRRLRDRGVRIAIDDFGTGYSSLLQLRTLPVDTLKVDRQFVDGLMTDPDDAVIVSASVGLALALRLTVVAEGVETAEQAEELRRLGCDRGQGFLWSHPLAADDFARWWDTTHSG